MWHFTMTEACCRQGACSKQRPMRYRLLAACCSREGAPRSGHYVDARGTVVLLRWAIVPRALASLWYASERCAEQQMCPDPKQPVRSPSGFAQDPSASGLAATCTRAPVETGPVVFSGRLCVAGDAPLTDSALRPASFSWAATSRALGVVSGGLLRFVRGEADITGKLNLSPYLQCTQESPVVEDEPDGDLCIDSESIHLLRLSNLGGHSDVETSTAHCSDTPAAVE